MRKDRGKGMLTPAEEAYALDRAYVPEHIASLMKAISEAEAFLIDDHLSFAKDNWLIIVGYPLNREFSQDRCEEIVGIHLERFRPEILWFIGPQVPVSLSGSCQERETDQYYTLDLRETKIKASLLRMAEKTSHDVSVERTRTFSKEHGKLVDELLKREKLPPRIRELYRSMPRFVAESPSACVLDARDKAGALSAFYVLDTGAANFTTYLLGTHSKKYYVAHASDRLFLEMIRVTQEQGKITINLGLGVNEGIRRFKEKWGGVPFLTYEFCERHYGTTSLMKALEGKL